MSNVGWELWSVSNLVLSLTDDGSSGGGFWFEALADGWDLGSPEAVKAVFASLAADGDDERITRHGNRQVQFRVKACGVDLKAVGDGERKLRLALNLAPRLELRYAPPDGFGEVTVFDVVLGEMPNQPDDLALVANKPWAEYAVTLTCRPFVRAVDPVTVSLTYSGTAPTTLKDGTSTTGVTATNNGHALTLSAVTYLTETAIKGVPTVARATGWSDPEDEYVFTGVTLSASLPYFAVDVALDPGLGFRLDYTSVVAVASLPGMVASPVGFTALANGYRRYFFAHSLAGSTVTISVHVRMQQVSYLAVNAATYIGGLYSAPSAPASGLMIADMAGSERTPLSLSLARSTSGNLSNVIVFSDPAMLTNGYIPDVQATWPNAPSGTYTAIVPSPGTAGHVYTLTINGQTSTTRPDTSVGVLIFEFDLGKRRDGKLGTITLTATDNGSSTSFTTVYLFRNEPGVTSLTYLPNVAARYMWIDSPTIERPEVGAWAGASADGSDAVSVVSGAVSVDPLLITPPLAAVWAVASGSTSISASATYFPLGHTFMSSKVGAA